MELTVTDPNQPAPALCGLEGQIITYKDRRNLRLNLLGQYQYRNAGTVLDTIDALRTRGFAIPEEAVAEGMAAAVWPSRFELLQKNPPMSVLKLGHPVIV